MNRIFSCFYFFLFFFFQSLNIQAATVNSGCTQDVQPEYDIDGTFLFNNVLSEFCYETTTYQLQGTGNIWMINGVSTDLIGSFGVNGTLELSDWTNADWYWYEFFAGNSTTLTIEPTGPMLLLPAETYTLGKSTQTEYFSDFFTDPIGSATSSQWEEYTNNNGLAMFVTGESLWNILVSGNSVNASSLDGDGDGYSGVNVSTYGLPDPVFIIDYQLTAVPVPAAIWLFISGIAGFIGISLKRKK